jgi:hypothetical protein
MLSLIKKIFGIKPAETAPAAQAPYKIETPIRVDGDVVHDTAPATAPVDANEVGWPFPKTETTPAAAKKPRAPRKPQPTVEKVAEPQTTPAAKKPATSAPRKPRAPKAAS